MAALLRQAAGPGSHEGSHWARMRVHLVASPLMTELGYSSKLNAEWSFLVMLRDEGRRAAGAFLAEHGDAIGVRSTLPIERLLEGI